jgi:RNA polymerase sigma factor (TIGR02999 family)
MASCPREEVTQLLLARTQGEQSALDELIPFHKELGRLAHRYMSGQREGHTLQTTALVNEAYLRLVDSSHVQWQNRAHFFAMAAQLMRRVLVDFARTRNYQKRGGEVLRVEFDEAWMGSTERGDDLVVALDDALHRNWQSSTPRKSQVVEMRFFGGLSAEETAEVLEVSEDTVLRDWKLAKTWLLRELKKDNER